MKKTLMLIVLLLSLVGSVRAADPNDGLALWGLTSDMADDVVAARLGLVQGQVEIGATVKWWLRDPWNEDVDWAGGYLIFHLDSFVGVTDPTPDNSWENALSQLIGKPYVGVEGLVPTHGGKRDVDVNWLVGTLVSMDPKMRTALVMEYATGQATGNDTDQIFTIGAMIRR